MRFFVLLLSFFIATGAAANTVTIDGSGSPIVPTNDPGFWAFQQNGFDVLLAGDTGYYPFVTPDFHILSDHALIANEPEALTFSLANGDAFSLNSINLTGMTPNIDNLTYYIDRPCGDGYLCAHKSFSLNPIWSAIKLVGKLANGTLITKSFSPWQGDLSGNFDTNTAISQAGTGDFGVADFGSYFSNIVSLTISLAQPGNPWPSPQYRDAYPLHESLACSPANLERLPDYMDDFWDICSGEADESNFYVDGFAGNDYHALLGSVSFDVDPSISPVPAPNSLVLMLSGLAFFGFSFRVRRRFGRNTQ